ncbi:MAG: CDP-diacylglycerol--serine O-phosphatidyltransferase [Gammaproteobacteria bacterium]|nr:CDP-diacylglycerol--serine O-phosphatidyltransferase [Gammaproteobacteria bacterium]
MEENVTPISTEMNPPQAPQEEKERKPRRGVYLLPNAITTGALFAGFYSIISAMDGALFKAAIAIVVAGFLDALDGRVARLTHTQSEFGVQYDSMSDLVAFGVAPGVLMFSWFLAPLGNIGWTVAFLYAACAALRLARFNTAPESRSFTGLASPAAAGILSTAVWTWTDNNMGAVSTELSILLAIGVATVALLMVSPIKYYSPKNLSQKGAVPYFYGLLIIFLFVIVFIYPPGMLLTIGLVYMASGPALLAWRLRKRAAPDQDGSDRDGDER